MRSGHAAVRHRTLFNRMDVTTVQTRERLLAQCSAMRRNASDTSATKFRHRCCAHQHTPLLRLLAALHHAALADAAWDSGPGGRGAACSASPRQRQTGAMQTRCTAGRGGHGQVTDLHMTGFLVLRS